MNRKHKIVWGGGMLAAVMTAGLSAVSASRPSGDACALQIVQAAPQDRTLPDTTNAEQNTLPGTAGQRIEGSSPAAPGTGGTSGMTPGRVGPAGTIVAPERTDTVTGGTTGTIDGAGSSTTTDNAGSTATDRTPGGTAVPGSGPATIPPTGTSGASGAGGVGGDATGGTAGGRTR
jgi:hypothetical protein